MVQSESLTLSGMCVCLVFAVILVILVSRVPGLVAGIITGSSITAMAFGGVGGAMSSASGIATGGAMIASQAAGAGLALARAYKATVGGMASGGGDSGDSGGLDLMGSGGSSVLGGLAGAMSGGLSFAYNMAANLTSGAAGAAKDDLQKTTLGGKMSAVMEADAQTQSGDDKGGGGDGDSAEGGGEAAPNAPAGTDGNSGGFGGVESQDSGTENGGAGASSAGTEPDFDAGAISSGGHDSAFDREWNDAIANYDPSKIGMPDS